VTLSQETAMPASDVVRSRARLVLTAAVVVSVVAAAFVALGARHLSHDSAKASERTVVTAVAGQLAVDFTSIDYRHLDQEFAQTAARATPAFAKNYLGTVKQFVSLYVKGKVVQTTSVDVAGIEQMSPTSARVLVALRGTATNSASPGGTQQLYRMEVDLTKQSGRWLASNVQPL
jgi:Mce-associated membrane protein